MNKEILGRRLREARVTKGYTRQALAKEAEIGEVYLGEVERGVKMPSMTTFVKILETLDISADSILRDELTSGGSYIYDELTEKLTKLTPQQRKTAADILEAYLSNLSID